MSLEKDYLKQLILSLMAQCPKSDAKFADKLTDSLYVTIQNLYNAGVKKGRRSEGQKIAGAISKITTFRWDNVFKQCADKPKETQYAMIKADIVDQLTSEEE